MKKDVQAQVCFCEALPRSGYVMFPRGHCSSSARMPQVKGMLHVATRGPPPLPRPGPPRACSSGGTAALPPTCFPPIPAEPCVRVHLCVWSLEDSFFLETIVKTARPLVSLEWFYFTDIWPAFPSSWALWMLRSSGTILRR